MKNKLRKAAHVLELPDNVVSNEAHIEITGCNEIVIDGCKGILMYDENGIKINAGKHSVQISGGSLLVSSFNDENMIITGRVKSIEFC